VGLHRPPRDGQPEPEAAGGVAVAAPVEGLEDRLEVGLGHAGPRSSTRSTKPPSPAAACTSTPVPAA
jgi:hypothetical protein